MVKRGGARNLTDYRKVLQGRGEIMVGAYARRVRRWRILLGAIGLLLIVGAAWIYVALLPPDPTRHAEPHQVAVACAKCGYRGVTEAPPAEPFPLVCPSCGERACYKLWECRNCGHQFLPKGGGAEPTCPQCGHARVGTATQPAPAAEPHVP